MNGPRHSLILAACLAPFAGHDALAQPCGGWDQLAPIPISRYSHAAAFDAARGSILVFGGYDPSEGYRGDTWRWSAPTPGGGQWELVQTPIAPVPRVFHAMAYDESRARVVLFGGLYTAVTGDTWEWDGQA